MSDKNLVQMVNSDKGLMQRVRANARKYVVAYVTAVALSVGGLNLAGCESSGDDSQCCAELSCNNYGIRECYCSSASPHEADKCVTNSNGQTECCSCSCYTTK
ncbi:MAG: hypothetical protein ABIG89_03600 [Candidatus Woesearchaeota archaeon]